MKNPVIGITLDYETSDTYSQHPWYALRENYAQAVWKYGGTPLLLPHFIEATEHYLSLVDGLLLTGGDFDIDPIIYGEQTSSTYVKINNKRAGFEMEICRQAIEKQIPILGICAGEQLLNVILGGSLIQHIPDTVKNSLEHQPETQKYLPSHAVEVKDNSLLHRITGVRNLMVNSSHHQAVKSVGKNVIVNAVASDTVIEGIEMTGHRFCLGVQWHPEFLSTEADVRIFSAFLKACR